MEFGEGVEVALKRELREELGATVLESMFIGAAENLFDNAGTPYHELNLVFATRINDHSATSKEPGHLEFVWVPLAQLERENVLPKPLISAVISWLDGNKTFWVPFGP